MHIRSVIENLGYPKNEVSLYLAALDMGESTITDLAARVRIPRTTVQGVIEQMQRNGLMNCYIKRRRKYWVAENPEKLLISLKEREAALKSIMPELQAKRFGHGGRPVVSLYNGMEHIKLITDDIIDTKHNILGIIAWDEWRAFFGDSFVDDFIERRYRHFLKIRLLTPRTPTSVSLKEKDAAENRHTRFLAPDLDIHNTNFIYGNKVAIISLSKRRPIGIVIDDPDIAHTMSLLFESMWMQSPER